MSSNFSRDKITQMIERSYELEEQWLELQSEIYCDEPRDLSTYNLRETAMHKDAKELEQEFLKLADELYRAGAFLSLKEARSVISMRPEDRRDHIGPDGVVPDDGSLNPAEEAEGILALFEEQKFYFRAPIARRTDKKPLALSVQSSSFEARVTSDHASLGQPEKGAARKYYVERQQTTDQREGGWIWTEGEIVARNYQHSRKLIEEFKLEVQGLLLVLGLLKFRRCAFISPPEMTIGRGSSFNRGLYVTSIAARMVPQLRYVTSLEAEHDLDRARGLASVYERNVRVANQFLNSFTRDSKHLRQAFKMFLRSFDAWSPGEAAMLLATTLEGLLLDKKNKDDLSARLQDSVAFYLGDSRNSRNDIKRRVSDLYRARSDFVHNGETEAVKLNLDESIELVRRVLHKELLGDV